MNITNRMANTLMSVQLIGDYFLFMGEILILQSIHRTNSCTSISVKTKILLAIVFTIRYTDLTLSYLSIFNTWTNQPTVAVYVLLYNFVKISHIFVTYWTLLITFVFFGKNKDRKFDTFRYEIPIIICASLALTLNYAFELAEIFWTFSFYLEAVAFVPQIHLISKAKRADRILFYYVGLTSLYKLSYMTNWIYSSLYLGSRFDGIAFAAGIAQLLVYGNFFVVALPLWSRAPPQSDAEPSSSLLEFGARARTSNFHSDKFSIGIESAASYRDNKVFIQSVCYRKHFENMHCIFL